MADTAVKLVIPSDLKNVYLIDMLIETLCSLVPLSDDGAFWIKLCGVEAVNNAIIHAYDKSPDHEVAVTFRIEEDRLALEVRDTGRPMPAHMLEGTDLEELAGDPQDLTSVATKGRGLSIIREMMDTVTYRRTDGENCLTMVKLLENGEEA
ncbi:MAG: ATP-binding protein [Desulfococcaceae bacterium]